MSITNSASSTRSAWQTGRVEILEPNLHQALAIFDRTIGYMAFQRRVLFWKKLWRVGHSAKIHAVVQVVGGWRFTFRMRLTSGQSKLSTQRIAELFHESDEWDHAYMRSNSWADENFYSRWAAKRLGLKTAC